jgi:hypothetical protein
MKKSLITTLSLLGIVLVMSSIQSCYNDNEEALYGPTSTGTCDTAAVKFSTFVSTIIAPKCATAGCHNASTAAAGANLSSYTAIKAYITNNKDFFLGSIKHTAGFSQMPKGGSKMASCDIAKIEAWIKAGMLNN